MSEVDLSLARSTAAALRANGTAGGYWPRTTRIDPAGANRVEIDLLPDGKGFSLRRRSKGLGIHIMRYRANALGGELKIEKRKRGGTDVTCKIPLKR